jgi:hypothetical protein
MTRTELAWELAGLFADLEVGQINEALAKNVPFETLEFLAESIDGDSVKRLPNLMVLGYLLRVLEDRLSPDIEGVGS